MPLPEAEQAYARGDYATAFKQGQQQSSAPTRVSYTPPATPAPAPAPAPVYYPTAAPYRPAPVFHHHHHGVGRRH